MRLTTPEPTAVYAYPALVIPLVGRLTGSDERFTIAEEAAAAVLSSPSATPIAAIGARLGLALLAVQRNDTVAAAAQYSALKSSRVHTTCDGLVSNDRVLALLAHTTDRLDKAADHFEDALAFCRKAGYSPELAWTCCDYADTLLQRNEPGDRAQAMALLDESLAISRELGMRPLMERVLSRREILSA